MATSDLILNRDPVAVLPVGDLQYQDATLEKFNLSYHPSWGRFKGRTHPAVGNHEYQTPAAAGYFDYFNGAGNASGPAGARSEGWYSYDLGGWHIVALNSNCNQIGGCGAGSPQMNWLKADLAAHPNACTLAYFHHPLYSSGRYRIEEMRPFWQVLYDAGTDVILNGHEHFYERFGRQSPTGEPDRERGIRQFTVGTGGRNHYEAPDVARNSGARDSSSFGALFLKLSPTGYEWSYEPATGWTFGDKGADTCAGSLPDSQPPSVPTSLRGASEDGTVALNWTASTDDDGVAGYAVFRDGVEIMTVPRASARDTTVVRGSTYEYRVASIDAAGNRSARSEPVTIKVVPTLTFAPAADASIHLNSPDANYGTSSRLEVDADTKEEFLMRFDVSGVGDRRIVGARLRLYNVNPSPAGGEFRTTQTGWSEGTVTWNTAPAAGATPFATLGAVAEGRWYDVDLRSLVTGDGAYAIRVTSPSSDGADYSSKEAVAAQRPQLVLELE